MNQKKLAIAVIGTGLIGRKHVELVSQSTDCTLAAIVDPAPDAGTLADKVSVARLPSLDALLKKKEVDGVILATPNHLHYPQALACIEADMPVLIEKPVTETVAQAEQLMARIDATGARAIVGHHRMHSAIMQRARAIIDEGVLGDIVAVQGSALFYKPDDYFAAGSWRTRKGGGPVLINMIHEVGNLRYLCGEIELVETLTSNARRGYEVEDTVGILLRFSNGAVGTFLLSDTAASCRSWEQTARENPDYFHDPAENCYHIAGTLGSLSVPTMTVHRFDQHAQASWWSPMTIEATPAAVVDPLEAQLAHFCRVIRGEEAPLVSVADGCRNLEITEKIARTGDALTARN